MFEQYLFLYTFTLNQIKTLQKKNDSKFKRIFKVVYIQLKKRKRTQINTQNTIKIKVQNEILPKLKPDIVPNFQNKKREGKEEIYISPLMEAENVA